MPAFVTTEAIQHAADNIVFYKARLAEDEASLSEAKMMLVEYRRYTEEVRACLKDKVEIREALDEEIGQLPATDKQAAKIVKLECDIQSLNNDYKIAQQKSDEQVISVQRLEQSIIVNTAEVNRAVAHHKALSLTYELGQIEDRWIKAWEEMISQSKVAGLNPYDLTRYRPNPRVAQLLRQYGHI
ncbi:hypothetical protein U9S86_004562 [Salmonella enterica]|nr:hypothetical protein [Salmonella enterica]EHA9546177.1 hypothetical protein [Salmonella enterica subsp. enterica serovar Braenderup]EHP7123049.1 hypothetical protein [Salmonella enterica subsp. enterica serovar Thompson]EBH4941559.1 hypothetical protein [Salmonella enterica]ECK3278483.1 hypothetical protein [Salmonella enterica]